MLEKIIIFTALFSVYFHIGGLATTNILRLTKGNNLSVLSSVCRCDSCGNPIPAHLQLPVISYILCKGKCKNCSVKIPVFPLFLELIIMFGMFIISAIFNVSPLGIVLSFIFYEITRLLTVIINGKRENGFLKNYITAVLLMIPFLILTLFISLIYSLI